MPPGKGENKRGAGKGRGRPDQGRSREGAGAARSEKEQGKSKKQGKTTLQPRSREPIDSVCAGRVAGLTVFKASVSSASNWDTARIYPSISARIYHGILRSDGDVDFLENKDHFATPSGMPRRASFLGKQFELFE